MSLGCRTDKTIMHYGRGFCFFALIAVHVFQFGCQRGPTSGMSSIVIQAPSNVHGSAKSGVSSLSLPPSNRKSCYAVSVTAPDISSSAQTCGPEVGIIAGFVESGGTIEASVPRGSNRKIQLYLYLEAEGENLPCPTMGRSFSSVMLTRTYLLGEASGVTLQNEIENVTITASFPGLAMNIAKQLSLPASCTVVENSGTAIGGGLASGSGVATGAGLKLSGSIGRVSAASVASGSGYQLKVRDESLRRSQ